MVSHPPYKVMWPSIKHFWPNKSTLHLTVFPVSSQLSASLHQTFGGEFPFKPLPVELLESQMLPVHRQPDSFPLLGRPMRHSSQVGKPGLPGRGSGVFSRGSELVKALFPIVRRARRRLIIGDIDAKSRWK